MGLLYLALRYTYEYVQFIRLKSWTAVVSFDLKPEILTDFTPDRSHLVRGLDERKTGDWGGV